MEILGRRNGGGDVRRTYCVPQNPNVPECAIYILYIWHFMDYHVPRCPRVFRLTALLFVGRFVGLKVWRNHDAHHQQAICHYRFSD